MAPDRSSSELCGGMCLFDQHHWLRRFGAWGMAAVCSLAAATLIARTGPGHERLQHLLGANSGLRAAVAAAAAPATLIETTRHTATHESEIENLSDQVRRLTADRDRLSQRVAELEQRLVTTTGAIHRLPPVSASETGLPTKTTALEKRPPAAPVGLQTSGVAAGFAVAPLAPPSVAPIVTPPIARPLIIAPLALAARQVSNAGWTNTRPEPPQHAIVLPSEVRLPPRRVPIEHTTMRPSFGIDLGRAKTLDELAAQWAAIKANFGPILAGLHSVPAHDAHPGKEPYRLVAGPLPDKAAARNLCIQFAKSHVDCHPVELESQHVVRR